jgi:hypothetical protein
MIPLDKDLDEAKLDKDFYPDGYYINNKHQVIPQPMNWNFFFKYYKELEERLYPKFMSELTRFGPSDEIISFASISWYKDSGKILIERASASGMVFTIRQIAKIAHIYGDKITLSLINKALDKGEALDFSDVKRLYEEITKTSINIVVNEWITRKLPFSLIDMHSLEGQVDDYIFARALKYVQDNGVEVNGEDFLKFVSYLSEKQATEIADKLLSQGYIFTKNDLFYLDGRINESALSRALLLCNEPFTVDDLNELDGSVTRACLLQIAENQGGNIVYEEYKGFVESSDK